MSDSKRGKPSQDIHTTNYEKLMQILSDNTSDIEQVLMQLADERQAAIYRHYFKTDADGYGAGDHFLGLTNPKLRLVVKETWRQTSVEEVATLVSNKWHEVRLCGLLMLVAQYERACKQGDEAAMRNICDIYLSLHPYINNWDLVDLTVYKIAGRQELLTHDFTLLDDWIRPGHTLWQRRMAMVATWIHARHGFYDKLIARAEALLTADHDLLHKATGWILREMYKHDQRGRDALECFLEAHISLMPSVTLSYAMEKMSERERAYWRAMRKREIMAAKI